VAAAQILGLIGLFSPGPKRRLELAHVAFPLGLFVGLALVQLIPFPLHWVRVLSPNTLDALQQLDPAVANGLTALHPLSIAPRNTGVAIAVVASLAFTILGVTRLMSIRGAREIAGHIVLVGVALALTGIIQKPLYQGKIYGFWQPIMGGNPFGPFVNRNHFAGWMLMGVPVTLSLISAGIARGQPLRGSTVRDRVIWTSSAEGSRLILLFAAAGVMILSLFLTGARSGVIALLVAVAIMAALVVRRQPTRQKRVVLASAIVLLVVGAVGWLGVSSVASRFSSTEWIGLDGRVGAWTDAILIFRRFWAVGTGLNTYGVATSVYQTFDLAQHYAQAHNDYLQLAAEGGLLLTIPALLCVASFLIVVRRRFRDETSVTAYWLRVGAVTGMTAVLLQEVGEFSLQMPGNAFLFAVLCAIALHRAPNRPVRTASK